MVGGRGWVGVAGLQHARWAPVVQAPVAQAPVVDAGPHGAEVGAGGARGLAPRVLGHLGEQGQVGGGFLWSGTWLGGRYGRV